MTSFERRRTVPPLVASRLVVTVLLGITGSSRVALAQPMQSLPRAVRFIPVQQSRDAQSATKITDDAEELVRLAQKLKGSVDKSNKDTLSMEVIRDAERVEKRARQLRESSHQEPRRSTQP